MSKTIFRVEKNKDNPFVMIDRRPIENPVLSWKAKGLLAYLLSRPDNWVVRFRDLINRAPDGAHTVRAAMKELKAVGHVKIETVREGGRVKQWIYTVHESPDGDFQQVEKQQVENRALNDNKINKNKERDTAATEIFTALENLIGSLNSNTPRFVDIWLEKHHPNRILQAIGVARENRARSVKYVDEVLISWEANGYPKTREEKVQERKGGEKSDDSAPDPVQEAIRKYFKLTPDWTSKYNESFMTWTAAEKVTPNQIEKAARVWMEDKRFNWQVPSLKGIQEHWLELRGTTDAHIDYKKNPEAYNQMVLDKIREKMQGEQ